MAGTLDSVVKVLTDSGIVALGNLEKFIPPKAHPTSVDELVAELVKNGHLTKFQATHIAAGKAKALILGGYTVVDRIGAGGMGQVFKAVHRRMDRIVAIKLLPPKMTKDPVALARFEREARAAAKLKHSNIVTAYDADQANGAHFLVMEFVDGKDLSAIVKKSGPFSVDQAVAFILQAAQGLEYAHKRGVIHRDIKPANMLLTRDGTVKILDMGLARLEADGNVAAQVELTGTGAVMGTVDYMAPEQSMSTKHADARADIYSLGCALYYLIAGNAPYDGETMAAKLLAHHTQPIPDLRAVQPDVSEQLQTVFKKMVAKKIDDRYQTMTEVIADLRRLGVGSQPSANIPFSATASFEGSASTAFEGIEGKPTTQTRRIAQAAPAARGNRKLPPWKKPSVLIGAGAAALLILLLGVWVISRGKDGQNVARGKVPAGGTATVQTPPPNTTAPSHATAPPTASKPGSLTGTAPPLTKAPFDAAQAKAQQEAWAKHLGTDVVKRNSIGMQMVLIPPGEFLMGSSDVEITLGEKIAKETETAVGFVQMIPLERPQHLVRITKPLRLSIHEVTVGQFAKFVEHTNYKTLAEEFGGDGSTVNLEEVKAHMLQRTWRAPGYWVKDTSPVTQVSWNDAVAFCNWLSSQEQLTPCYQRMGDTWTLLATANGYRLPTEAEWEYACRAGTTKQYWFGDNWRETYQYGWTKMNALGAMNEVGLLPPNPFGLHDMHGNVWEWCFDSKASEWYRDSPSDDPLNASIDGPRVCRGGSWRHTPATCRSAYRGGFSESNRTADVGFRVAVGGTTTIQASTPPKPASTTTPAGPATAPSNSSTKTPIVAGPVPSETTPPTAVAPFDATKAKQHQQLWAASLNTDVVKRNGVGMQMVLIPPGEFLMGSSDEDIALAERIAKETNLDEPGLKRIGDERPQHAVRITKPLRLSAHEVTVGQFAKFVEQTKYKTLAEEFGGDSATVLQEKVNPENLKMTWRTPGYGISDRSPVTQVSWNDAAAFCNWLSDHEQLSPCYRREGDTWVLRLTGDGYRLPTEAEWEYACRAGTTTQYSFGNDWQEHGKYGWTSKNAGGRPQTVGQRLANPFGLHDMHGNAWEWCYDSGAGDWYARSPSDDPLGPGPGRNRVLRGGGWEDVPAKSRSAYRVATFGPTHRSSSRGFRVTCPP